MANTKISELPNGSPIVQSTDYIPIIRGGNNYKALLNVQPIITSITVNNLVSMNASGVVENSGINKDNVATINQMTEPQAGELPVFGITGENILVPSGFTTSDLGGRYAFFEFVGTLASPSAGDAVPFNNEKYNNTNATLNTSTGIITLAPFKRYKFRAYIHPRWANGTDAGFEGAFTVDGNTYATVAGGGLLTRPVTATSNEHSPGSCEGFFRTVADRGYFLQFTILNVFSNFQDVYGSGSIPLVYMILEEDPL